MMESSSVLLLKRNIMKKIRALSLALLVPIFNIENTDHIQAKQTTAATEEQEKEFYIEYQKHFGDIVKEENETTDEYWNKMLQRIEELKKNGIVKARHNSDTNSTPYIILSLILVVTITGMCYLAL